MFKKILGWTVVAAVVAGLAWVVYSLAVNLSSPSSSIDDARPATKQEQPVASDIKGGKRLTFLGDGFTIDFVGNTATLREQGDATIEVITGQDSSICSSGSSCTTSVPAHDTMTVTYADGNTAIRWHVSPPK